MALKNKSKTVNGYHYQESGLDNVYLYGGVTVQTTERGERVHIQDVEGLHREISYLLISEKKKLNGREFRFLRHELNMTQEVLAALLGTDVQSVARWEKGKAKVPGPADRLIRLLYSETVKGNRSICEPLKRLAELDELMNGDEEPPVKFTGGDGAGWHRAA